MSTKEELINVIRGWVKTDNEIKQLQCELKNKKNEKKAITEQLVEIMKTNEIDCFDINEGKLVYKQNKSKAPLSKKHLLQSLTKYFPESKGEVDKICAFIMDTREDRIKENIERKNLK